MLALLAAKYEANLLNFTKLSKTNIIDSINTHKTAYLIQSLYNEAISLVKNDSNFLPLSVNEVIKTAIVNIGNPYNDKFVKTASFYRKIDVYTVASQFSIENAKSLENQLANYDVIIFNYARTSNSASRNYGIYQASLDFINKISNYKSVVVNLSANPYALKRFETLTNIKSILVSYEDNSFAQTSAASAIFGGINITGKIPFSASDIYKSGFGIELKKKRLTFIYIILIIILPPRNNLL